MILYYIVGILFFVLPFLGVLIWKYIYPQIFVSYKDIIKNSYILLIAIAILSVTVNVLIWLPNIDMNSWVGNFYLHAIAWWVPCALMFLYIIRCINIYIPYIARILMFFMFLCTLWVSNELLEFLLEYMRLWTMQSWWWDTRQDLLANTVWGMIWFVTTQYFYDKTNITNDQTTENKMNEE